MSRPTVSLDTRFWSCVIKHVDCWLWRGAKDKNGYGVISGDNKKQLRAPRVSWELHFGHIPNGLVVRHACDNPGCVNPDHLLLGSLADNSGDMVARSRSLFGTRNHKAKIAEEDVLRIRKLCADGDLRQDEIAAMFGVNNRSISMIAKGKTWTKVGGPIDGIDYCRRPVR